MKDVFVADLAKFDNQKVDSFFSVTSKQLRSRKDGGQYLALMLGDRTGQVESRMWDNFSAHLDGFKQGDIVKVRGEVSRYNGRFQLTLDKIRCAEQAEADLSDFLPQTACDVDELWSKLDHCVESISDPHLKALLRAFLADEQIARAFRQAPAAKSLHHAWLGGLLEHIVSLVEVCEAVVGHYPEINRDLLLTGAILHDIGKLKELSWSTSFEYTIVGQLLGHISIGVAMVEEKLAGIPEFPHRLRILVEHMILSHHGKLEFGSPKLPMIPEAILLHYLDDMDAKMQTMRNEFIRQEAQGRSAAEMTEWVRALDRPLLNTAAFLKPESNSNPED